MPPVNHSPISILILALLVTACGSEEPIRSKRNPKTSFSNKFIGVSSSCSRGTLTVDVRTQEPFSGSVYARGYPSRCKVVGEGTLTTSLVVSAQKCGVKVIEDEEGDHTYELLVYIQFDKWVQQVIDEQVHVRCRLQRDVGQLKTVAQINVVNRDAKLKDKSPKSQNTTTPDSNRSDDSKANNTKLHQLVTLKSKSGRAQDRLGEPWNPAPLPQDLLLWRKTFRSEGNSEPVSSWMDIVKGDSADGKPVIDHLLVGEEATMVMRVRQSPGLDTRITSCIAHDGSGEQTQELIDEDGCAVDDAIMPPLRIKRNPKTGLKIAFSTFKAFKFPDRDNLHLKCTVLVCLGFCKLPPCGRTYNRIGRLMEVTGQGSIQPVEDLQDLFSDISQRESPNRIVDRVEVFNSVEVRAPGIESRSDLVKQYRVDKSKEVETVDFFSEENMFCVTPYKMVLAFGVLLAIMLVAVLFALYSCIKSRYLRAPMSPHPPLDSHRHSPVGAPYYRFAH